MIIIHCCSKCGHNDLEGRGRLSNDGRPAAKLTACAIGCACRHHTFGPPETAPSFDTIGRPIERLAPPGTRICGPLTTCPCDDCKALYERLAEGAA